MFRAVVSVLLGLGACSAGAEASEPCPGHFAVEVLGSGGPLADDARASAGYLVWIDGEAKVLIDVGGGVFLRFAESGANLQSLDAILISHFHADHVADLPALLKSGSFEKADSPLTITGPSGNAFFPGLDEFLRVTFDKNTGVYRYLSTYIDDRPEWPQLDALEIDAFADETKKIALSGEAKISAIPVNHGAVPALAYTVTVDGVMAVFAGDQSLFSSTFDEALADAEPALLIAHHAISGAKGQPRGLHRDPSSIGDMATEMQAQRLVLSHNMTRALNDRVESLKAIAKIFSGPVEIAEDHSCYTILP